MNKRWVYLLFIFLITSGCLNSVGDSTPQPEKPPGLPRELTAAEEELIRAEQLFSYDMFGKMVEEYEESDNMLISPISTSLALAMMLNGASGETKEEIQEALYLTNLDLREINESCKSMMESLYTLNLGVDVEIANAIWHREELSVKEAFVQDVQDYLSGEVLELDAEDDDESAEIINNWVKNQTNGYIDYIDKSISSRMIMYLISATYLRGDWLYGFDPGLTRPTDFYVEDGLSVEVEMMELEAELAAYISDEVLMAELPYEDDLFTMILLMPGDPQKSIDEFIEESLTAENMSLWTEELTTAGTRIRVPELELEYEYDLKDILESMGLDEAFGRSADFSNISESDRLYLDEVVHKALVTIDEEGEELPASVDGEREIYLNRPFVFLIRERHSGAVLFMGKVENPLE